MASVGIIGWGVVGQATGDGFKKAHKVLWHDPYKEGGVGLDELVRESEFIFVCVPTPMYEDHSGIDLSIVEEVVRGVWEAGGGVGKKTTILKSTVIPGTTARLQKECPDLTMCANPEFLTESRAFEDFLKPDRTIIGAFEPGVLEGIKALYEAILPSGSKYFLTDPTSAELAKYASNVTLASRVVVANEIYLIARALGVDYAEVREMVAADVRIGPHRMTVPGGDGRLGFGGKCLPKDLAAFLSLGKKLGVDLSVLEAVFEKNLEVRGEKDWEAIAGAVSRKNEVEAKDL